MLKSYIVKINTWYQMLKSCIVKFNTWFQMLKSCIVKINTWYQMLISYIVKINTWNQMLISYIENIDTWFQVLTLRKNELYIENLFISMIQCFRTSLSIHSRTYNTSGKSGTFTTRIEASHHRMAKRLAISGDSYRRRSSCLCTYQ